MMQFDPVPEIVSRHPEAQFMPAALGENDCGIFEIYLCMIATNDGAFTFERHVSDDRVHWYVIDTETDRREQVPGETLEFLFTDVVVRDHPVYDVTTN